MQFAMIYWFIGDMKNFGCYKSPEKNLVYRVSANNNKKKLFIRHTIKNARKIPENGLNYFFLVNKRTFFTYKYLSFNNLTLEI